ncbi:hypothetical protein ERJ75_000241400 [Trypanosoma vivax]|nr:hypothetical protein TRVL_01662 [Trypanosoma vivax]KAH8618785.1 hypothetical protein ERJ75_000241400 [Trypanosoma vivax]
MPPASGTGRRKGSEAPRKGRGTNVAARKGRNSSVKDRRHHQQYTRRQQRHPDTSGDHRARPPTHRAQQSARSNNTNIHLAAQVASELRSELGMFKARLNAVDIFGAGLSEVLKMVPPPFIQQHLPEDVRPLRSYLGKFERGAPHSAQAFIMWYEWAEYELNKGKGHSKHSKKFTGGKWHGNGAASKMGEEEEEEEEDGANETREAEKGGAKLSQTRMSLSRTVNERGHVRALLQMCVRHNSARRKEGQHALINHLKSKIADDVDCRSLKSLRETAHHTLPYALSRMILGMVTEDLAMILLHTHTLYLTLNNTAVTPSVILSLIGEEIALDTRLKATKARLDAHLSSRRGTQQTEEPEEWDDFDPDKINDPTKGERNQRIVAAVFAMSAITASSKKVSLDDARVLAHYLCFAYIEQKATRVLTATLLMKTLERFPLLWEDESVVMWISRTFFLYPKLEYFRPECVQLLLRLMTMEHKPALTMKLLPVSVRDYMSMDPLEPSTVEQLANALFRKEQVTAVHPMVHPVWDDWFELLVQRCAAGESLQEHLSTMMHNAIAPYRRGNADIPRRTLFQQLVARLGQLAVQSADVHQRVEMLQIASKTVGYGRDAMAKPTDMAELRLMPLEVIDVKVHDLIQQYRITQDADPSAHANRTWVLRELRACLNVPLREGVVCTYANDAALALLQFGFFPPCGTSDDSCMNRAIYLFADLYSFTYSASLSRPKCTVDPLSIIGSYLEAEEKGKTRYMTGSTHAAFRKARNCIVEALENSAKRSVLFYEERDIQVLLVLLFLVLSTDDYSNEDAKALAISTTPDLCQFFQNGTLETLDLFYDVLMALVIRPASPIHVMPLMACVRRIATGYMLKFARYVRSRATLDLILAPLREAYHTDDREKARQAKAKGDKSAGSEEDSDDVNEDDDRVGEGDGPEAYVESEEDGDMAGSADEEVATECLESGGSESGDGTKSSASETETESVTSVDENDDEKEEEGEEADIGEDLEEHGEEESELEEEEAPTQHYINALKGMIGDVDLQFVYPADRSNRDKSDVMRAIQIAARVGSSMRSPLTIHIFQVLLAVCRENVKSHDDVIFNNAVSSVQMIMMTKHRYFGCFVAAEDLFQLLSDIQSYCRKVDRVLVRKEGLSVQHSVAIRRRMSQLKDVALRVFHFIAFLAYKNHAGEDVRLTLLEFYKSIFYDRGWDEKKRLPSIKRDMHHYRHGFAWALLPAAFEKFSEISAIKGPQRVRVFKGCCHIIEAVLPRLSGTGAALRGTAASAVIGLLQSVSIHEVYAMKFTLLYDYLHCLKMVLKYNSRVQLDTAWAAEVVREAVDNDSLMLSSASIRLLAAMERLLGLVPRARETKVPTPVSVLYQQYEKRGRKEKAAFYRRAKRVREKVVKALAAYRNGELTDAEKAAKRHRREKLRINDRIERQMIRAERSQLLTKEEREEKRKHILMAKQERIARNRERKRRLHEQRERAFQRWREKKLAEAAAASGK